MKTQKLTLFILFLMIAFQSIAQIRPVKVVTGEAVQVNETVRKNWDTQIPEDCFCCSATVYKLPVKPKIEGAAKVQCGDKAQFSTFNCPGAAITWSVSPTVSFTGQNTNTITINPPLTAGSYTVTVAIKCGEKTYSNQKAFTVEAPKNCVPNFLLTVKQLPNGTVNINAVPTATAGVEHYWGVVYNGTYPNCSPCAPILLNAIQGSSTFGAHVTEAGVFSPLGMGTGITGGTAAPYGYNYSGFPNNSCFKVTHYVKCCGVWYRQTQCVSIGTSNAKVAAGTVVTPNITIGEVEKVE